MFLPRFLKGVVNMGKVKLDEIGYWSEVKLDIVREYATAYSTVMAKQSVVKSYMYVDAFAGAGTHISKTTGEFVSGSPLNALLVQPPFKEFHFIDLDGGRAKRLRTFAGQRPDVHVHEADCNDVLLNTVFPRARYRDYKRALCLLDPYALNLKWEVIRTAGQDGGIEIFLNFMIMDINMNVLKHDRSKVREDQAARLTSFWGDDSWSRLAYESSQGLFGPMESKTTNQALAEGFRKRLQDVAGFKYVPEPVPMRNKTGAIIYYLYFASANKTGAKIVTHIFDKYRNRMG
jgi:three-Cys-motif partner protein